MSVRGFDPSAIPVVGRVLDRLTIWDEAVRRRWPFSALGRSRPRARRRSTATGRACSCGPPSSGSSPSPPSLLGSIPQGSPFVLEAPRRVVLRRPRRWASTVEATPELPRPGRHVRRPRAVHAGLVRLDPHPLAGEGGAGPQARDGAGAVDRAAAPGAAVVQPRHLQLRRAGRDDEPPHQPVPLRPRRPRRRPVGVVGRPSVAQHPGALRAAVHGDRRLPHERVGAQRARRPGAAAAAGPGGRRPHGPVASRRWRGAWGEIRPTPSPWPCSTRSRSCIWWGVPTTTPSCSACSWPAWPWRVEGDRWRASCCARWPPR